MWDPTSVSVMVANTLSHMVPTVLIMHHHTVLHHHIITDQPTITSSLLPTNLLTHITLILLLALSTTPRPGALKMKSTELMRSRLLLNIISRSSRASMLM